MSEVLREIRLALAIMAGSLLVSLFIFQCGYEPARRRMEREFPYHVTTTTVEPVQLIPAVCVERGSAQKEC